MPSRSSLVFDLLRPVFYFAAVRWSIPTLPGTQQQTDR